MLDFNIRMIEAWTVGAYFGTGLLSKTRRPGATARLRPRAGLEKCQRWIVGVQVVHQPPASHLTKAKCHLAASSPWVASGGLTRPHRNYELRKLWHSPHSPLASSLPPLSCLSLLPCRIIPGLFRKQIYAGPRSSNQCP